MVAAQVAQLDQFHTSSHSASPPGSCSHSSCSHSKGYCRKMKDTVT